MIAFSVEFVSLVFVLSVILLIRSQTRHWLARGPSLLLILKHAMDTSISLRHEVYASFRKYQICNLVESTTPFHILN